MTGKRPILEVIAELEDDYGFSLNLEEADEGNRFDGLCPLHDDENPSFSVYLNENDDKSRWACWTCSPEGGDVIDLVMRIAEVSYHEAIEIACEYQSEYDLLARTLASKYETKSLPVQEILIEAKDALYKLQKLVPI